MLKAGVIVFLHQILDDLEALEFPEGEILGVKHLVGRLVGKHAAKTLRLFPQAGAPQKLEKAQMNPVRLEVINKVKGLAKTPKPLFREAGDEVQKHDYGRLFL